MTKKKPKRHQTGAASVTTNWAGHPSPLKRKSGTTSPAPPKSGRRWAQPLAIATTLPTMEPVHTNGTAH